MSKLIVCECGYKIFTLDRKVPWIPYIECMRILIASTYTLYAHYINDRNCSQRGPLTKNEWLYYNYCTYFRDAKCSRRCCCIHTVIILCSLFFADLWHFGVLLHCSNVLSRVMLEFSPSVSWNELRDFSSYFILWQFVESWHSFFVVG